MEKLEPIQKRIQTPKINQRQSPFKTPLRTAHQRTMEYLNNDKWTSIPCFIFVKGNPSLLTKPLTWRINNQYPKFTLKNFKHLPFINSSITINPEHFIINGTYKTYANLIIESSIIRTLIKTGPHDGYPYQHALQKAFFTHKYKLLKQFHNEDFSQQIKGMGHTPFGYIDLDKDKHDITLKEYIKASLEVNPSYTPSSYCQLTYDTAIKLYR